MLLRKPHDLNGQINSVFIRPFAGFRKLFRRNSTIQMAKPCGVNHVATGVDGNSHQPGLFAAVPAKGGKCAVGLDKGFLYRVLGQRGIVQLDIAQAKQIGLVLFNQSDEPLPGVFICDDRHVRITSYTL